jgi:hypothetical protein
MLGWRVLGSMDPVFDLEGGARLTVRPGDDGSMKNADLELVDSTGARWTATVLTLNEIDRLMTSYEAAGDCMSGAFFACPDLLMSESQPFPLWSQSSKASSGAGTTATN